MEINPDKKSNSSRSDIAKEVLKIFFSKSISEIKDDLRNAEGEIQKLHEHMKSIRSLRVEDRTPELRANLFHLSMVQAYELCRLSHVVEEFKIFYASTNAEQVTEEALMESHHKGKLSEISNAMDLIRKNGGLSEDEFWALGEGPDEYESLNNDYEHLLDRISDTVFTHILTRYQLSNVAQLFEQDRTEFEIQREVGRRLAFPESSVDGTMNEHFEKMHGKAALKRVESRVNEIKLMDL